MSKIDEVYRKHVLNQGNDNTDYLMVFKVLDELKPYVELAELHLELMGHYLIGRGQLNWFDWFDWTDRMNELYAKQKALVEQIKEQQ